MKIKLSKKHMLGYVLPYCLKKTSDGSWLMLNRDYKPIWSATSDFVDYDKAPIGRFYLPDDGTVEHALSIAQWCPQSRYNTKERLAYDFSKGYIYLYSDDPATHGSKYYRRLSRLMELIDADPRNRPLMQASEAA